MRSILVLPLIAALSLAACKRDGVVAKDESVESVAQKVAASDIKLSPGRWESRMKLERMEMDGVPPQVKDALARQMGAERTFSSCLTPEQVEKPDGGFFGGGAKGCVYKKFLMVGGRVDNEMVCSEGQTSMTLKVSGTYSASEYNVMTSTEMSGPAGTPMRIAASAVSQRTGDCDGKEDITAQDMKKMEDYAKSQEAKAK